MAFVYNSFTFKNDLYVETSPLIIQFFYFSGLSRIKISSSELKASDIQLYHHYGADRQSLSKTSLFLIFILVVQLFFYGKVENRSQLSCCIIIL